MGKIGGNDQDRQKVTEGEHLGSEVAAKGASAAEELLAQIAALHVLFAPTGVPRRDKRVIHRAEAKGVPQPPKRKRCG